MTDKYKNPQYYFVNLTDYIVRVTTEESNKILQQFQAGNKLLYFHDMYGAECFVPASDFHGMWYTDEVTRKRSREHSKLIDDESEEPSWK